MSGWAASAGVDGATALYELASSVEQTAALACNLLCASHTHLEEATLTPTLALTLTPILTSTLTFTVTPTPALTPTLTHTPPSLRCARQRHPEAAARVAAEQQAVLKGVGPRSPITPELLDAMPELDAFTREVLRLYPPARPARRVLEAPLELRELRVACSVGAGTLVAPEPFVAHFSPSRYPEPQRFDPQRFVDGDGRGALIPFATAASGSLGAIEERGEQLAVSMAKAIYVQACRMFDDVKLGASPEPMPAGFPLYTVPDKAEALFKARMYYELQRGVKKLRF